MFHKKSSCVAWLLLVALFLPLTADAAAMTHGTATVFANTVTSTTTMAKIDATHVIVAYGDASKGYAAVGTVNGTSISFGTAYQFYGSYTSNIAVTQLDSTHALIVYNGASSFPTGVVATISGTTLSYGSSTALYGIAIMTGANGVAVSRLDSTHAIVGFTFDSGFDSSGFGFGNDAWCGAVVTTISGTSVSAGSASTFDVTNCSSFNLAATDATHFMVVYRDGSGHSQARGASISGTSITFGSATQISTAGADYGIAGIDSTHVLIAYRNASAHGSTIIGTISGSSASFGTATEISTATSDEFSVAQFDSTHAVINYYDQSADNAKSVLATISGTNISLADSSVFHAAQVGITMVAAMNSTTIVSGYRKSFDGNGYAVVGTNDTTGPSAPSSFTATPASNHVTLNWVNPVDSDFASVTIRRSTTSYPATTSSGSAVASGQTGTTYTDNTLSDGTYYYSIFAKDVIGNFSTAAHATATVDTVTQTPTLTAPISSSPVTPSLHVAYTLPESPTTGTVTLNFNNGGGTNVTVTMENGTSQDFTLNLQSIAGSPVVTSTAGSIPDGTYAVTLSYQDARGNTAATATATAIVLTTPVVVTSSSSSTASPSSGGGGGHRGGSTARIVHALESTTAHATEHAAAPVAVVSNTAISAQMEVRTCKRVTKWFGGNESAMNRVNARLQKWLGFRC